jgi:uncharacterized damage-inducible protein DinB
MKIKPLALLSVVVAGLLIWATPKMQAQSSTPAQVIDQLLSQVEGEMVPLVEAMPADKFNFAPTNGNFKGVRTFAQQVQHVTEANYSMYAAAASMKPTNMPDIKNLKTKAQLVQALKDSFAFAHQAIATVDADNALEAVKPVDGIDTRAGIMLFAIIHMNDHFGQMVEYLRMNGIVPPSSMPRGK